MASTNKSFLSGQRLLLLALVAGVISAVLVGVVLTQATKSDGSQDETVAVIVAQQDIPAFTAITSQMVEVNHVTTAARERAALGAVDQVVGRIARNGIGKGEQISNAALMSEEDKSRLAFNIPASRRAVSVAVSEVISAGGLIQPGDFVDVLVVLSANSTSGGDAATPDARVTSSPVGKARVLLQNVQVLAVAQQVGGPLYSQETDGMVSVDGKAAEKTEPDPKAKTVTLAVTLAEAQQLFLGEELGELRLAVRPAGDNNVQPVGEAIMSWTQAGE